MEKKGRIEKLGVMNFILILVGIFLFIFTITMIILFVAYGSVPDTLVTCVFAALGGECGVMGWIKTTKERYKDREWEKEDRELENGNQSEEDEVDDFEEDAE